MFARINFLFAVAALTAIVFYLIGRFFLVAPVAAIAPQWALYAAGAVMLVALALIVRTLSRVVKSLETVTNAARQQPTGLTGHAGQLSILLAHLFVGVCVYRFVASAGADAGIQTWGLAIVLYAAGAGGALADWRKRAAASVFDKATIDSK